MTRLAWWTPWASSRVSTSTICLDLEMSWCPRLRSKKRLSTMVVVERIQDSTAFVGAQHGPLQDLRPEERSTTFCGGAGPRRGQLGQPLPPERVAERLARIDALLAQVSLDEEEVMEEEIPEVQPSRFQGVFRPRRLCRTSCGAAGATMATGAPSHTRSTSWQMKGATFLGLLPVGEVCTAQNTVVIPQVLLISKVVLFPSWCYYRVFDPDSAEIVESLRAGLDKVVVVLGVMQRQTLWFRQCSTLSSFCSAVLVSVFTCPSLCADSALLTTDIPQLQF